ncbi:ATP-dependent RNA helicase HrpA [Saccharospirillum salsuginis]|uniref:ATP-dependent helicase n=1 Tax=Saccharospirillum salsuginis TaxID=418750 RepID=A0A918KTP2_9GAMM|nr:ATP-dependent RNA helicase HrpA [Saccharospirillum salsuginis]GGX75606.1 ATP-dependent helicase [Saccharospirillum salsuginis]
MSQSPTLTDILDQLHLCLVRDRHYLRQRCRKWQQLEQQGKSAEKLAKAVRSVFERSRAGFDARTQSLPAIRLNEELPVSERADDILAAIQEHQVVVIAGETGSGKTTQLPKLCLEAGLGRAGVIGHTQPRRLAARSVASRIAEELNVQLGGAVGYQVRFTDSSSENTLVKLMTDGILLNEIQHDPFLNKYDAIIIDEAHERSLNIDFLLGYLKQLLSRRPDLKLIITSATIDVERFSEHFGEAPVIEVSGRSHPVDVLYRPMSPEEDDYSADLPGAVLDAVQEIERLEAAGETHGRGGDVLVFLPGEREIRETFNTLKPAQLHHTELLPLYARLSASEQQRIFASHSGRRIVLSTNVAETSLTVPGIHYVVDSGLVRISRYSYRSKVQRLPIEPISQASANQRAGRCGRIAPGLCIRLYDEEEFQQRPEFTDPEILRTNLASVILQMLHMRLGHIEDFPFLEPPDRRMIRDGYTLLNELAAVNDQGKLTPLGKQLARLPVDPRIGRMVIEGQQQKALSEILVIASALSIPDPRERPQDKQQAAAEKHAQDKDKDSDFLAFWNLWQRYEEQRQALSQNQLRKFCKTQFLNYLRMREWRDIHRQLHLLCKDLGYGLNEEPAGFERVHKALASGLLSQIAAFKEDRIYTAARGRQCRIHPSSALAKKGPKWLMAAELVETTQLFARTVAKIEPRWLEPLALHLVKRQYTDPHWEKKRGQVVAKETLTLYGLPIVSQRPVHFGKINPEQAREIFIRAALVEGEFQTQAPFFEKNRSLLNEVTGLEDKARRRDILVDDETLFAFYDERIPEDIVNSAGFHAWLKNQPEDWLELTPDKLMQHAAEAVTEQQYPDHLTINRMKLPLSYRFEPTHEADGVTLTVPAGALAQLPEGRLDWLVPGMLRDKIIALIKSLPKAYRRNFVPVPDFADALMNGLEISDVPLYKAIGEKLFRMTGVRVPEAEWQPEKLEPHHRIRFRVVDEAGKTIATGRDLEALKQPANASAAKSQAHPKTPKKDKGPRHMTDWDCGDLPDVEHHMQAGIQVEMYPALVDKVNAVAIESFTQRPWADAQHTEGLLRLAGFRLADTLDYLGKRLPAFKESALLFAPYGKADPLRQDILWAALRAALVRPDQPLPRTRQAFDAWVDAGRGHLVEEGERIAREVHDILSRHHKVRKQLKGKVSFAVAFIYSDIAAQLDHLVYPGFVSATPDEWRAEIPRYIDAADKRINRSGGVPARENLLVDELNEFWQRYETKRKALREQQRLSQALTDFRWYLEEYRVSLFAQTLGTKVTISNKRLEKQWQTVLAE